MLILCFLGCKAEKTAVNYADLYSHMEVSLYEENEHMLIRAVIQPYSYATISSYHFEKVLNETATGSNFFLTFYLEAGDVEPVQAIKYTEWGGIELRIPKDGFDRNIDKIFYRDEDGEYELAIGTKESWRNFYKSLTSKKEMIEINKDGKRAYQVIYPSGEVMDVR
jgi:hypothetical protein